MKPYAAYLFDLDGTLVDTAPDINVALNRVLAANGWEQVDEALTRHWVGHGARALVIQAVARQSKTVQEPSGERMEELVAAFIEHYEAHIADLSRPYPGVVDALSELAARGARLAVVTNKLTRLTEQVLDGLDLTRHFQTVVCGDTTEVPKPAADPALLACERLGVAADQALFVGDSSIDVGCARAAGCPVVVVRDGYNHGTPASKLGADAVIESFSELV